jgi:hypothetical protein
MNYSKNIPVSRPYDLVVCGGGPAGCAAALAARREGLSVLLAEGQAQPGGMATSGLVSHWLGGRTQEGAWVVGGLFRELAEEAAAAGCALLPALNPRHTYQPHGWLPWFIHGIPVDPYGMARFLDGKLLRAGVDLLYETRAIDAVTAPATHSLLATPTRITHVVLQHKGGLEAVPASAVVDATGDADVAAFSGCEVAAGREEDGLMTPASLTFHLYNVDHRALHDAIESGRSPKFREKIDSLRRAGEWPFPYEIFISVRLVQEDVAMINTMRLTGVDGLDARSRTQGLIRGRAEAHELLHVFRRHFPGFEKAELKCVAPSLGIRETRRIGTAFRLRVADLAAGTDFEDTVGFSMYGWDLPDPEKPSRQPLVDESGGRFVNIVPKSPCTPIPYRIMVPRPVENLLCPGRAVGVERDVLGPLRVMAPCMAMGEACGAAAAQMVGAGVSAAAVDTARLRERLRATGALVDRAALPPVTQREDP